MFLVGLTITNDGGASSSNNINNRCLFIIISISLIFIPLPTIHQPFASHSRSKAALSFDLV
jgi:hypothetical protein